MAARLANRLNQARRQRFVGRSAELELFRAALSRDVPDFAVLHLYGPGGMGKTTLLRQFAHSAQEAGHTPILLDGRHLDASPAGFFTAVQMALNLPPEQSPLDVLASLPDLVLLLDTYELLMPLDGWLRESFLPELPERAIVVIAGRQPPPAAWRAGGWAELTRIISLRNLRPEESATYLRGQGLPESQIDHVLGMTYGHPLALSLAADLFGQNQSASAFDLKQDPDIVRVLLERFVADVPNPTFRQALEICAHAFTTDEEMLAHCLGAEHSFAAFQWLRDLSFIEQGPFGLFPHDLVRELLEAELRWRNLKRFRELHFQVRSYIIQQIQQRTGLAQQFAVFALLFLHRNNPFMRSFYEWQSLGQLYIDVARRADMPAIEQMIRRHQGEESLAAARYWQTQPQATFYVFRAAGSAVAGFCQVLEIGQVTAEDSAADPAVATAVRYLQTAAPLRPGEVVLYFRNWIDAEHYQDSPAIFNMAAMVSLRLFFNTPRLAYSFIAQSNSDHYADMFEYLRMPLAANAGFAMDEQSFGVFAHDWRAEPVLEWMNIMGERELLDEIIALENLPHTPQPVVLSEPEFAEAVRQALKDVRRPDLLAQNPLLRSRCLRDRSEAEPTPAHLQALLREGAETLTASPKSQKLYRVLWHTFFEPAPTQEAAAELLDLPFSTYRYQLGKAVEQLIAWLWRQELYGVES
ncbi:MAG TPA: AAA family ATPase [Chloroflexota bacterium]|nr:AAA family ATPase [Chloroflexota bacterium]